MNGVRLSFTLVSLMAALGTAAGEEGVLTKELGGKNVLVNSSFEMGDAGWLFGPPREVQSLKGQGDRRSRYVRDFVRDGHSGTWALRINETVGVVQEFALEGLKCRDVAVGLWAKGVPGSRGEVALYEGNGTRLGMSLFGVKERYESFVAEIALPKGFTEPLKVVVRALQGKVVVDDVQAVVMEERKSEGAEEKIEDLSDMDAQAAKDFSREMKALKDAEWERKNQRGRLKDDPMVQGLYCRVILAQASPEPISFMLSAQTGTTTGINLEGWPEVSKKSVWFGWDRYWMGALPSVQFGPPGADAELRPGETSPWIRIMPPVVPETSNSVTFAARHAGDPAAAVDFVLELAMAPDDKQVFFRKRCAKTGSSYIVLMPGRVSSSKFAEEVFDEQYYVDEADKVMRALGAPGYGKRPERFTVSSGFVGTPATMGTEMFRFWIRVFHDLGLNSIDVSPEGVDTALGQGLRLSQHVPLPGDANVEWLLNSDWGRFESRCRESWAKFLGGQHLDLSRAVFKVFGNETNAPGLGTILREPAAHEWFRAYLASRGLQPKDFAVEQWSDVRPCTRYEYLKALDRNRKYGKKTGEFQRMEEQEKEDEKQEKETQSQAAEATFDKFYQPLPYDDLACARIFYWSNRFRAHTLEASYHRAGEIIFKTKPAQVQLDLCTGYFSDGWMHEGGGNMFEEGVGSGSDLLNMLKTGGGCTSMGASNLIYWAQLHGWTTDILRASGKGGRFVPVHDGLVPSWRDPLTLEYTMFMKLAHGTKSLYYFPYGPYPYHLLDGPLTGMPWFFGQIRRINYMLGDVEDLLLPGIIPRAQVALIYNQTADIWALLKRKEDAGDLGAMGVYKTELNEKRGVWLALRHGHYACDILSDWDLAEGILDHYRVAYLPGSCAPNIDRKGADALVKWVEKGGTLWVDCQSPRLDEYGQPLNAMERLSGVVELGMDSDERPRAEIEKAPYLREFGVPGGAGRAWAVNRRCRIKVQNGAKVMSAFDDGLPAVVENPCGAGRVYYVASYPGLSYMNRQDSNVQAENLELRRLRQEEPERFRQMRQEMKLPRIPAKYPEEERAVVTLAARSADLGRWVVPSAPVIHWGYLISDKGICVPLINYLHVPQEKLGVSVEVSKRVGRVRSTIHGDLAFREDGGRVEFSVPLDHCDFVCIHYRE